MHKFPDSVQKILDSIKYCSNQSGTKVFLRGDLVLHVLTGNSDFLREQKIDLIISYPRDFNTHKLYQNLIRHIAINKEIENSPHRYHIVSSGYEIRIDLIREFDPTQLSQAQRFGSFNLDLLFIDLETEDLKHPPEVSDDPKFLKNIHDKNNWNFEDVLGFVIWSGIIPDITVDADQYSCLRLLSLGTLKESLDITWEEQIETILLLRRSGSSLNFIAKTFADGMSWTFKVLIEYMISLNAGINEDSNVETVFNDKKFELVDLYNEFFLEDKKAKETAEEIHHRLTTILKLLFDSPNLSIARPYINTIRTISGGLTGRCCLGSDSGGSIVFFGCGDNISEADCMLPTECSQDSNECLREHPSFSHIPDARWNATKIQHREWCVNQVCPDIDNIHCQQADSIEGANEKELGQ